MNDKQLTILIDGREALPVRAIPYAVGWRFFTPDRVADCLAGDRVCGLSVKLTAYKLSDNKPAPVMPGEWKIVQACIDAFGAELWERYDRKKSGDKGDKIGYYAWMREAQKCLHAGTWVWLDELKKAFQKVQKHADTDWTQPAITDWSQTENAEFKEPPDDELILAPMLDATIMAMVMAGFEMPPTATGGSGDAAAKVETGTSPSGDGKPWLIVNTNDPESKQDWYTPARYFARQLVTDDSTLLTKKNLLAKKVSASLANVGIFKRGGKYPIADTTILKAFVKVTF